MNNQVLGAQPIPSQETVNETAPQPPSFEEQLQTILAKFEEGVPLPWHAGYHDGNPQQLVDFLRVAIKNSGGSRLFLGLGAQAEGHPQVLFTTGNGEYSKAVLDMILYAVDNFPNLVKYVLDLREKTQRLEIDLADANGDAERLAAELELEQNPGYTCLALQKHRQRLYGEETKAEDK